jgi:hypothetical protein
MPDLNQREEVGRRSLLAKDVARLQETGLRGGHELALLGVGESGEEGRRGCH